MSLRRLGLVALVVCLPSCSSDPVKSHLIESLGGEAPGVPEGPLHRAGQPCVACHQESGPADTVFSLAGTVYQDPTSTKPLPDARIHFIDASGKTYDTGANCAGNFFVMAADYSPSWPVWTSVIFGVADGQPVEVPMESPIYREGSCAMCHQDGDPIEHVVHVYFAPAQLPVPPPSNCP